MHKKIALTLIIPAALSGACMTLAARPINLAQQPISTLTPLIKPTNKMKRDAQPVEKLEERNRDVDMNQTTHIRMQETYAGVPVWGGDSVMHIKHNNRALRDVAVAASDANTSVNGIMYQDLGADLLIGPEQAQANAARVVTAAISLSHHDFKATGEPDNKISQLIVYVDTENKAHYAFFIQLFYNATLSTPSYIVDAVTFQSYKSWNDTKRLDTATPFSKDVSADDKAPDNLLTNVAGGGFGGNENTGKLIYDGMNGHLSSLSIQRDDANKICYLQNTDVVVKDARSNQIANFSCDVINKEHNNIYWAADFDTVNGGYSPANDALYAGSVIKKMYLMRYHTQALVTDKNPMLLEMIAHSRDIDNPNTTSSDYENAVWYSGKVYLGDGGKDLYPLTSLQIIAHEVAHGFTEQHSNLIYEGQSGGLNESFSDMSAEAAEFYATGKENWEVGPEVTRNKQIIRDMQSPTKDGHSIDNAKNFTADLNVHLSSGVFNRLFYLLSQKWGVEKTFEVMLQANAYYWTPSSNFRQAACDVKSVVENSKYNVDDLNDALKQVGLEEPCLLDLEKPILDHAKVDIVLNDPDDLCDTHTGEGMQIDYDVETIVGNRVIKSGAVSTPYLKDQQTFSMPILIQDKLVYQKFQISPRGDYCRQVQYIYYADDAGTCDNNLVEQFHSRNIKIIVTPVKTHGWLGDNYKLNCKVES